MTRKLPLTSLSSPFPSYNSKGPTFTLSALHLYFGWGRPSYWPCPPLWVWARKTDVIMHQSIPVAPTPPPTNTHTHPATSGNCSCCQSWWWGIGNLIVVQGIFVPQGHPQTFDTRLRKCHGGIHKSICYSWIQQASLVQVNIWIIIYLNCGGRCEVMIDHRSYTYNLRKNILLRLYYKLTIWPAPSSLDISVGRALHWYCRGYGLNPVQFLSGFNIPTAYILCIGAFHLSGDQT